jgi:hypothetical protein
MYLINVEKASNYEKAFLSRMRIDIRKKIQNASVFLMAEAKSKEEVINLKDIIIMKDATGKCHKKSSFRKIDFEVIDNDEFNSLQPDYFNGKYICEVIITSEPDKI